MANKRISEIHVSVDAVVFGYQEQELQLLLIERGNEPFKAWWALPGGLVNTDESLEAAVERELEEETSVKANYLEQLYTYGAPNRDPRNRVVAVAYFGLVRPDQFTLVADTDAAAAKWFPVKELPKLAFDHQQIIDTAIQRLRAKLTYEPIGFELLDKKFPFSDLEKLYSTILDREIDRRNFRKKILNFGILTELDEKVSKGKGRPGSLYEFKVDRYEALKKEGILFEIL